MMREERRTRGQLRSIRSAVSSYHVDNIDERHVDRI